MSQSRTTPEHPNPSYPQPKYAMKYSKAQQQAIQALCDYFNLGNPLEQRAYTTNSAESRERDSKGRFIPKKGSIEGVPDAWLKPYEGRPGGRGGTGGTGGVSGTPEESRGWRPVGSSPRVTVVRPWDPRTHGTSRQRWAEVEARRAPRSPGWEPWGWDPMPVSDPPEVLRRGLWHRWCTDGRTRRRNLGKVALEALVIAALGDAGMAWETIYGYGPDVAGFARDVQKGTETLRESSAGQVAGDVPSWCVLASSFRGGKGRVSGAAMAA